MLSHDMLRSVNICCKCLGILKGKFKVRSGFQTKSKRKHATSGAVKVMVFWTECHHPFPATISHI